MKGILQRFIDDEKCIMATGLNILPGTRQLAKNLLADAKALVIEVHGTPEPVLIAGMVQALVALKLAERLPDQP